LRIAWTSDIPPLAEALPQTLPASGAELKTDARCELARPQPLPESLLRIEVRQVTNLMGVL
jgi:hypothetical protein